MIVDPAVIHAAAARGDDVYPYAEYRPISEDATQPTIVPWSFILHTMAGPGTTTPDQLWRYIARGDISGEPHLLLGYDTLIQAVRFTVSADNNYKANSWRLSDGRLVGAVSVETQDNGSKADPGIAKAPWNQYQLDHLAGICAFLKLRYGVPLTRCDTWDARGVDGHRAHEEWSKYVGKSCPGETRWHQIPDILAAAWRIVSWRPEVEAPVMQSINPNPRLMDTRPLGNPVAPDQVVTVATAPGRPAWARSALVNITVAAPTGPGFVTAWAGGARPGTSNVNYSTPGQSVANTALVPLDAQGRFVFSPAVSPCHVIIDQQGWAA